MNKSKWSYLPDQMYLRQNNLFVTGALSILCKKNSLNKYCYKIKGFNRIKTSNGKFWQCIEHHDKAVMYSARRPCLHDKVSSGCVEHHFFRICFIRAVFSNCKHEEWEMLHWLTGRIADVGIYSRRAWNNGHSTILQGHVRATGWERCGFMSTETARAANSSSIES